jgi:hypothetical protein
MAPRDRPFISPFDLGNQDSYLRWRDWKLTHAPRSTAELLVEVGDPRALKPAEHEALLACVRRCNMAIYASPLREEDTNIPRVLGYQFGLESLDSNWLA